MVGSLAAAIVAVPIAIQSNSHDDTALLRDFPWPHEFEPYVVFSVVFLGLLIFLLGYFHLGRLGALLGLGSGLLIAWLVSVFAVLSFLALSSFRAVWLSTGIYGICVLAVWLLLFWVHMKATASRSVRQAQRKMRLV